MPNRIMIACLIAYLLMPVSIIGANYDYKVLKNNKPLLRQIQKAYTIYELKENYNLRGDTLKMPPCCILRFLGGHITNGTVVFDNTIIESSYREVFCQISIDGKIANREVWLSWWKLAYDKKDNDAILINQVIKAIDNCIFYYDIQKDIFVGGDTQESIPGDIINVSGKHNLRIVQPTEFYTVLKGRSKGGHVICLSDNTFISVDGLKVDGGHVTYGLAGENGIGVTGNEKVLVENCIIKNCFSNCFDEAANGRMLSNGYPEWGSGGKGIQIEGGQVATQATIRNNSIRNCYIGISNNASDQENIIMDGNFIDSCYMSLVLMRLGGDSRRMNVNVSNTIISNNTGDVGAICMGNAVNVNLTNTQVKGDGKVKSVLRGCFSYCNIQMIVNQECENLIDAALYRDNPEGVEALYNYVRIITDKGCDYILNTSSSVVPKKNGSKFAEFVGGEFDITMPKRVKKTLVVLPSVNNTTIFSVKYGGITKSGNIQTINKE